MSKRVREEDLPVNRDGSYVWHIFYVLCQPFQSGPSSCNSPEGWISRGDMKIKDIYKRHSTILQEIKRNE